MVFNPWRYELSGPTTDNDSTSSEDLEAVVDRDRLQNSDW